MMFSRRPALAQNRGRTAAGRVVSGALPSTPLGLVSSVAVKAYWQADLGTAISTGVSAWADQSGNGFALTQGGGGTLEPAYSASDATLNNLPTITADGVQQTLASTTLTMPTPGTTPSWFWAVLKQVTWSGGVGRRWWGAAGGGNRLIVFNTGVTPQSAAHNAVTGPLNAGATIGSWIRAEAYFSNTVSDYLKLAGTSVTGTATGNNIPTAGFTLFANGVGTQFSNIAIYALGIWLGQPTAGEKSALDAWVTAKCGGGVGL